MGLINETGTYRGLSTDWGVSTTKNGFPQFVVSLNATEVWDKDEEAWVDISGEEATEITAFLVLFGKSGKPTLNAEQVEKAYGWNGASFSDLANGDYSDEKVLFRVEENEYEGNVSLQVNWIDSPDASPGRSIGKLSDNELKALDAQYSKYLKKPATKPAKAKKKEAAPPKRTKKAKDKATLTEDEAWQKVISTKDPKMDDEECGKKWLEAIEKIAGDKPDADITGEEWAKIAEVCQESPVKF